MIRALYRGQSVVNVSNSPPSPQMCAPNSECSRCSVSRTSCSDFPRCFLDVRPMHAILMSFASIPGNGIRLHRSSALQTKHTLEKKRKRKQAGRRGLSRRALGEKRSQQHRTAKDCTRANHLVQKLRLVALPEESE
jgi:hypothetical protein